MMVVFRESAVDAVACASLMHDEIETLGVEPPAYLRVGVSAGESAIDDDDDDWYGTPVVEAARLSAIADAGHTLVTDVVRVLVGTRGGYQLRPLGSVTLKGISQPVAIADVVHAPMAAPLSRPPAITKRRAHPSAVAISAVAIAVGGSAFVTTRSHTEQPRSATSGYTPRVVAETCRSSVRALVPNATCGVLVVPEDRERPSGRWIRVKFSRYPTRDAPSTNDPVIELATALDGAEIVDDPAQSPVRDDADLIVFGGRGLASSDPSLTRPEFAAIAPDILRHPENDAPTIAKGQTALRACHDRLARKGVALDHYTVTDEADDVVDLVRALHLQRVNLQGVWDSARVALAVAREAPDVVRTMFLLDPEVPRSSFIANPATSLSAAFDRYVALCEADHPCHASYPNLAQAFRDDVARQAARPRIVIPTDLISGTLRVTVKHPPVLLDGDRLAQGLAAALTSSMRNMPLLPAGIAHPNATLNGHSPWPQNFPLVLKDFPWGGFLSRMCSYETHTRSAGAVVTAATRAEFAGYDDPAFRWTCDAWKVPEVQRAAFAPVSSAAPTLIVEQQLDPRWESDAASQLRAGLTHVSMLSFPTLPGGAAPGDFPACYNDLRRQFVHDPNSTLDTEACARQSPPIRFVVPTP